MASYKFNVIVLVGWMASYKFNNIIVLTGWMASYKFLEWLLY